MGQYITEAKFGFNKLFDSQSGRNLSGTMVATLVGIFPKIILQFGKLTKSQMEIITPILDSARQTVTYYDPTLHRNNTIETYTGDYEITNKQIITGNAKNDGFSCSFIAVRKRS